MGDDMEDKAKRVKALLSSFYGEEEVPTPGPRRDTLQGINEPDFDSDRYMASLLRRTPLDGLLQRHVEMAAEIKNLDSDMQMLVYENYNKFISATDTIKRMKENVGGIETNMDQLLEMVTAVRGKSDGINASLSARRERIEELNGTRSLLRKVQFIFDLPNRMRICLKSQDYARAIKYYKGALPILKAYGKTSFMQCKDESDKIVAGILRKLESQVMDTNLGLEDRAMAVKLLHQLDHPVDKMVETFLAAHWDRLIMSLEVVQPEKPGKVGHIRGWLNLASMERQEAGQIEAANSPSFSPQPTGDSKDFVANFTETMSNFRTLFPTEEQLLMEATLKLLEEYFTSIQKALEPALGTPSIPELIKALGIVSRDTSKLQMLIPDRCVGDMTAKAVESCIRFHIAKMFRELCSRIIGALVIVELQPTKEGRVTESPKPLRAALDNAKRVILFDSVEVLRDLRELLDKCDLIQHWKDTYVDLVHGSFQDLFTMLNDHFNQLSSNSQESSAAPKALQGLILIMALLSIYIQETAVPKITEVVGASFVGGGAMGFEARPAFVPSEICRTFFSSGEMLLLEYVDAQVRKCSNLIRKSVETPNWSKYKEPRDVRMFVDLLLQEFDKVKSEVEQVLDHGITRGHRRNDSTGSAASSRSNATSMRDTYSMHDGTNHRTSSTYRARGRALERDVAKLFKQESDVVAKLEFTQVSVMSTVIKRSLETFQECVQQQTFNRSGYNQIQLDAEYLRDSLRNRMIDEEMMNSLVDDVCMSAAEKCTDPIPLEVAILDKLIDARRAKLS